MTTMLTRPPATSPAATGRARRGRRITKLREPGREYKRVVVYLRISRDLAGDEHGVKAQYERAMARVAERGWTVVAVYDENNRSASDPAKTRKFFKQVVNHVLRGECDIVLAPAWDRLVRMNQDFVTFGNACREQQVMIHLLNTGDIQPWTQGGWTQLSFYTMMAETEMMVKSDRQVNANQARARLGLPHKGSRRAFGYKAGGSEIKPAEAETLKWAYKFVETGGSINAIVRKWNDEGYASSRGKGPFTRTAVRQILMNPRNAGVRTYWYESFEDEQSGETVMGEWPAIVTQAQWAATVRVLNNPTRYTSPGPERKHLLSGLMRCGVCAERGEVIYVKSMCRPDTKTGESVSIYGCNNGSKHLGRNAARIERVVMDTVLDYLAKKAGDEMLAVQHPDVEALRTERDRLKARKKEFARRFMMADEDPADYEEEFAAINNRIRELNEQITDDTIDPTVTDMVTAVMRAGDDQEDRMAEAMTVWENYDLGQRRALIDAMATVTLNRGKNRAFDPTSVIVELKR